MATTNRQLTPEKARVIKLFLALTGLAMIILGLVLLPIGASPVVAIVLVIAGVMDILVGFMVIPKLLQNQNLK